MNREKDDRTEIKRRVVAHPGVKFDDVIGEIGEPIAAFSKTRFDAAMQHFPQRGNADHSGNVIVFDGAGEFFAVEFVQDM